MKTEHTKPTVLICGRNGSSNLCMARSFGSAGYPVEVLRITQKRAKALNLMQYLIPEAHSKYVRAYHDVLCNGQNRIIADKLLQLAKKDEKMLLIPTCDMAASAMDAFMEQLREFYWIPNVADTPGEINRLMRKDVQTELAGNAGLPVINSCVIETHNGEFTIPDSVRYPCFIKPNVSRNSVKSTIGRCDSEAQLREKLTRFSRNGDIEMLVEDFVQIRQEYGLLGLCTPDGAVCPAFFEKEQIGSEDRKGVTMVGHMISPDRNRALVDGIARFVHSLGFVGLFDVDIVETTEGKWYFVELNLRYGASGFAVTQSGVNLPVMYADYRINGQQVDLNCAVECDGKRFVSEKVMMDEYARGFLTLGQIRNLMNRTQIHFIDNSDDPKPYRHFRKFYLFGMATRLLFKLKRTIKSMRKE